MTVQEKILSYKTQILIHKLCPEAHACSTAWITWYEYQIKQLENE